MFSEECLEGKLSELALDAVQVLIPVFVSAVGLSVGGGSTDGAAAALK